MYVYDQYLIIICMHMRTRVRRYRLNLYLIHSLGNFVGKTFYRYMCVANQIGARIHQSNLQFKNDSEPDS